MIVEEKANTQSTSDNRQPNNHTMNKSTSLPISSILSINSLSNPMQRLSLPPPLESPEADELDENNKENLPPPVMANHQHKPQKRKSVFDDSVPALELLADETSEETPSVEKIKVNKIKEAVQNEIIAEIPSTEEASELIINEECQESGDVAVASSNVNDNNNNNIVAPVAVAVAAESNEAANDNNNNNIPPAAAAVESTHAAAAQQQSAYMLTSNGRLLESEADWYRRPKVTYDESGDMVFRPLRMKCTHCDEAYTKTHDLYAHIRTHQNHTKCPHCGKILTCMATFVYHVRTHTAEKPYYCPCDGCDFKNAVKYNLKVHLACIRHGGKDNLKKYAKVLDLDVCEKSLRKRKDNSVHELGSRRSKRRRKMNTENMVHHHENNVAQITQSQHHYYPKQEECDQYTAQLLFSLSGIPPVFDQNMTMNQGMMDWTSIIGQNAIKSEQSNLIDTGLKPEQYYDPLYGYYGFAAAPNTAATLAANMSTTNSLSASTLWSDEHSKLLSNSNGNSDVNSDGILQPKQEPVYHADYGHAAYLNANHQQASQQYANHQQLQQQYANLYYGSNYYMNYNDAANHNLASYTNQVNQMQNQQAHDDNNNNNKQFDLPPLQFSEFDAK